ncbi:hypothetical protein O9929_15725 [Vibrio lentus]|nr:hypothetical protein [Vibrio lentus]
MFPKAAKKAQRHAFNGGQITYQTSKDWISMIFICKDTKRFNTNATCAEHGERSSRLVLQIGSQILTTRGDDAPKDLRLNLEAESPLSLIMLNELTQSDVSTLSRCKTKCVIGINRYRFHRS